MKPENYAAAMGFGTSHPLTRGKRRSQGDASGFDWFSLENYEAVSPLTREKYYSGK